MVMSEQCHAVSQLLACMPYIPPALLKVGLGIAQARGDMNHSTAIHSLVHDADLVAAQLALLAMPSWLEGSQAATTWQGRCVTNSPACESEH